MSKVNDFGRLDAGFFRAQYFLLVLGGGLAGFVNTLAGGGSFLTIPLLMVK